MTKTETFRYHQNNSGGFVVDAPTLNASEGYVEGFDIYIYASSKDEANRIAESKGIYFDGVRKGRDCECCGDRWYMAGYPEPASEVQLAYEEIMDTQRNEDHKDDEDWMDDWNSPSSHWHY
jgi:hypothetical protein